MIEEVDMTWQANAASIRAALSRGLQFSFNNIATSHYRKVTSIVVPDLELQMLLPPTTGKQWLEVCRFRTNIGLDMYKSPQGWRSDAAEQRKFLAEQDGPTQRFADIDTSKRQSSTYSHYFVSCILSHG